MGFLSSQIRQYKYCILSQSVSLFSVWLCGAPEWVSGCGCSLYDLTAQEPPSPGPGPHTLVAAELSLVWSWHSEEPTSAWLEWMVQRGRSLASPPQSLESAASLEQLGCASGQRHTDPAHSNGGRWTQGKKALQAKSFSHGSGIKERIEQLEMQGGRGRKPGAEAGRMLVHLRACHGSNALLNQIWVFFNGRYISIPWMMLLKHVGFGKCFKKQEKPVNRYVMCCQALPCAAGTGNTG